MAPSDLSIHQQLELFGVDELLAGARTSAEKQRISSAAAAMEEDFSNLDASASWIHSAFCQTGLPHSRPANDAQPWHRKNGSLHLVIEPGTIIDQDQPRYVGVPYGAKARLILIYIQTHVRDDGVVPLGRSLSDWMRNVGFAVTGGPRGTIGPFREQVLRLARARISIHWTTGGASTAVIDRTPVDGLTLWADDPLHTWHDSLHLSPGFLAELRERRMPLYVGAIRHLRGSSLALDLYCWLAYRLHTLSPLRHADIRWSLLRAQLGADFGRDADLAAKIRAILPDVLAVYPYARVETVTHGLRLYHSHPPVPKDKDRGSN